MAGKSGTATINTANISGAATRNMKWEQRVPPLIWMSLAIKAAFVEAFNQMLGDKEQYIARFEKMLPLLADTSKLEKQLAGVQNKHGSMMNSLRLYMEENTRQIQDQEEYNRRFSKLDAECKKAEEEIESIRKKILSQSGRKEQIRRCLDELRQCGDILEEFDLDLWNSMIESVTVCADEKLVFLFRDGTEVTVQMPEKPKMTKTT